MHSLYSLGPIQESISRDLNTMWLANWVLAKMEVKIVLKLIKMLEEGRYNLKYATIEDFEKYLKIEGIEEETDGLVYRKTVTGVYSDKFVELNVWSCDITTFRHWVCWF